MQNMQKKQQYFMAFDAYSIIDKWNVCRVRLKNQISG